MQDASASFVVGRTTMIITHRLSSLHYAVRIFIFEDGHISQEGSYEKLLPGKGIYRRLYDLQSLDGRAPE
jgi:ABC-type multidrug transport system fused ATPase/permease subunit